MSQVAFTAPHPKVAEIGYQLLREGHNAVDAIIAAAAAISVICPHEQLGRRWILADPRVGFETVCD